MKYFVHGVIHSRPHKAQSPLQAQFTVQFDFVNIHMLQFAFIDFGLFHSFGLEWRNSYAFIMLIPICL